MNLRELPPDTLTQAGFYIRFPKSALRVHVKRSTFVNKRMRRYECDALYFRVQKIYQEGIFLMAKRQGFEFVNVTMTAELSNEFKAFRDKNKIDWQDMLAELGEHGYKTSFTYVHESDAWVTSVSAKKEHPHNPEKVMTTWSGSPSDGLLGAFWKVFVLFRGGVWETIDIKGDIW